MSQCVFAENSSWSDNVSYRCSFKDPSEVHSHVINGRTVQETPPPPPPKPEKVRADIIVPPGPYKKDGSVLVEGVVLGEDGNIAEKNGDRLRVTSGHFVIRVGGIDRKIPARTSVTGSMEARIPIPDAPDASIFFVVDSIADSKSFTVVQKKDSEKSRLRNVKSQLCKTLTQCNCSARCSFLLEAKIDTNRFRNSEITLRLRL